MFGYGIIVLQICREISGVTHFRCTNQLTIALAEKVNFNVKWSRINACNDCDNSSSDSLADNDQVGFMKKSTDYCKYVNCTAMHGCQVVWYQVSALTVGNQRLLASTWLRRKVFDTIPEVKHWLFSAYTKPSNIHNIGCCSVEWCHCVNMSVNATISYMGGSFNYAEAV